MYKNLWISVLMFFMLFQSSTSLAVMSVDLGADYFKVAIVKPGVPMEIVLNTESQRKTRTLVTLNPDERLFGDPGLNAGIKKPLNMLPPGFINLIGATSLSDPLVAQFADRHPHLPLSLTPRGGVQIKLGTGFYTVEEGVAMLLNYSRSISKEFAGEDISSLVVAIPSFWTQTERRGVVDAVSLTGMRLLQLISQSAAIALNYGVFRRAEFVSSEARPQNVMFFDMGGASTCVSIVEYKSEKESGVTVPVLSVKGLGFDSLLGSSNLDDILRNYLSTEFDATAPKGATKVTSSPRAMAKLLREARRVKQVLSANAFHYAQVEGLHEDRDMRLKVTREVLDDLASETVYARVKQIIDAALQSAGDMTLQEINYVIVFGGGYRTPGIQNALLKAIGNKELTKNINADEAAAFGAVYQAAHLSQAFRVKRFIVRDVNPLPIDVSFDRVVQDSEGKEEKTRTIQRTIFQRMNVVPQKKLMTFNRMNSDFSIQIKYGDLAYLSQIERPSILKLATAQVSGVSDIYSAEMAIENTTDKGVKAHFRLDQSGLLVLDSVEATFERVVSEEVAVTPEKSTFSKLTEKIGNFFSTSNSENGENKENSTSTEEPDTPTNKAAENDGNDSPSPPEAKPVNEDKPVNEENSNTTTNVTEAEKPKLEIQTKTVTVKKPLTFSYEILDLPLMTGDFFKNSFEKLNALALRDAEKFETARSLNDLESYVISMKEKLYDEEFLLVITEHDKDNYNTELNKISDWLYDEGYGADALTYKDKLKEIQNLLADASFRFKELQDRPKILEDMRNMLNRSNVFLNVTKTMPPDLQIFTDVELATLSKAINDTMSFRDAVLTALQTADLTKTPPYTIEDISKKLYLLDREVQYLVNKARYTKPKVPDPTKAKETNTTSKPETSEKPTETPSNSENTSTPRADL